MKTQLSLILVLVVCLLLSCSVNDHRIGPACIGPPYQIERINKDNFLSMGWIKQQLNNLPGGQVSSDQSNYMQLVCGPENKSDPDLKQGCMTMNTPTSNDPTLRRIRLFKKGYSGTLLTDLTELKYSTYVIQKLPTGFVLELDINNDGVRDFNIFYVPPIFKLPLTQSINDIPVLLNRWQQWDTLHGMWSSEGSNLPEFPSNSLFTIQELTSVPKYANARILDSPNSPGAGIRFTTGGPPSEYSDDSISFVDALIIGTKHQNKSILFDFVCN